MIRSSDPDSAKSVSHEHTFDEDTADAEVLERTLLAMAEGVSGRLRHAGIKAGTVTVKIRDSGFHTITRQRGLPEPTDLTEPIWRAAVELARPELRGQADPAAGRGGVGVRRAGAARAVRGGGRTHAARWSRRRTRCASGSGRARSPGRACFGPGIPAPFERDLGTAVERRGEHAEARRGRGSATTKAA